MEKMNVYLVSGYARFGHTVRRIEKYCMATSVENAVNMFLSFCPNAKAITVQKTKKSS